MATENLGKCRKLRVPSDWGMRCTMANKRLTALARHAKRNMVAYHRDYDRAVDDWTVVDMIAQEFLTAWLRMGNTKTYTEATTPEVRERVQAFHAKLVGTAGFDAQDTYGAWCANYTVGTRERGTWRTKRMKRS